MGKALYRKYRPKSLSEVVGQKHITDTLSNAIKAGKISHAYLLTGPRGVGKTSIARILAHEVNGLEYSDDSSHLDIIEIDAASNRRIDEIRDLRDKVNILPTSSKYKVYIIDEVHMLTREAFNALLKTLEEPPAHAIFILATTEAHKLPETITSRTQHFTFKPIETATVVDHLKTIAKSEKVVIDTAALELIAEHGDGSFRDSISLLDQARNISNKITESEVQKLLGIAPETVIAKLLAILQTGTPKTLFELLAELRGQGLQSAILAKQLSHMLRQQIIEDRSLQSVRTTDLLEALLTIGASAQPDRMLEIILLDYIFHNPEFASAAQPVAPTTPQPNPVSSPNPAPQKQQPVASAAAPVQPTVTTAPSQKPTNEVTATVTVEVPDRAAVKPTAQPATAVSPSGEGFSLAAWPLIVAQIKKTNNTIYGILKTSRAEMEDNALVLIFSFAFHQKQINEAKNRQIIQDIIKQQTGDEVSIVCKINTAKTPAAETGEKVDHLDTVSNIFGGGEVLE